MAKLFIGLGLNLIQGYGLTETSPIISGNPENDNDPASVGVPLPGVEICVSDTDELLSRSPSVMLGYWNNPAATKAVINEEGWFHTGDKGRIENNHIYITGRLKEIIVLSNGEKVSPADMEMAICLDPLVEQALLIGEGKPYLSVIAVLDPEAWKKEAEAQGFALQDESVFTEKSVQQWMLERIAGRLKDFPGYAKVRSVCLLTEGWTIEGGTMTPTMKLRREMIIAQNQANIDQMYEGH